MGHHHDQDDSRNGRKSPVTGLDIGATGIRAINAVQIAKPGGADITVKRAGSVPLEAGMVERGEVKDIAGVAKAIKTLRKTHKIRGGKVTLAVESTRTVVKEFEVPHMRRDELRRMLPEIAEHALPIPVDDALLDFRPYENSRHDSRTRKGLLLAVPKAAVTSLTRAVDKAGLGVAHVDLAPLAALRAAAGDTDRPELIIDIGAHLTSFTIRNKNTIQMVRTIAHGGEDITREFARLSGLDEQPAEQAKIEAGLTPANGGRHHLADALRPLENELASTLRYYQNVASSGNVETIRLTGRGGMLPGLADELSATFGMPAAIADPAAWLTLPEGGNIQTPGAVAAGLVLGVQK